jgi:putative transposase
VGLKRYVEANAAYFITSVTYERKPWFSEQVAAELLLNIILYHKFACHYRLYGFVIMPDHFHMVVQPYGQLDLSSITKRIKGNFTRFFHLYTGQSEPIWQKGFYDRGIRSRQELISTLEYMHNNPVRKGLATRPDKYEFSSCGYYDGGDQRFVLWIDSIE